MKYIVYWVVCHLIPQPSCETGTYKIEGKTVKSYCQVAHYKTEMLPKSATYYSRGSAFAKLKALQKENDKYKVRVVDMSGKELYDSYATAPYREIRIDSVKLK